jgi:hypothetical protein
MFVWLSLHLTLKPKAIHIKVMLMNVIENAGNACNITKDWASLAFAGTPFSTSYITDTIIPLPPGKPLYAELMNNDGQSSVDGIQEFVSEKSVENSNKEELVGSGLFEADIPIYASKVSLARETQFTQEDIGSVDNHLEGRNNTAFDANYSAFLTIFGHPRLAETAVKSLPQHAVNDSEIDLDMRDVVEGNVWTEPENDTGSDNEDAQLIPGALRTPRPQPGIGGAPSARHTGHRIDAVRGSVLGSVGSGGSGGSGGLSGLSALSIAFLGAVTVAASLCRRP